MSIISNVEEWETKKGTYAGVPGMKFHLGPLMASYPELVTAALYEKRYRYKCNVLLNDEQQAEIEDHLMAFARKYIAAVTKKGLNKGDPLDPIKMQWKARNTREGYVPIVTENGEKILKVETWGWAEDGVPRDAPLCWKKHPVKGTLIKIPHTEAFWGNGSTVSICGGVAVTYDKQKFNWVVKFMLSSPGMGGGEVLVHDIANASREEGCAFGTVEEEPSFGATAECDSEELYESPAGPSTADAGDY